MLKVYTGNKEILKSIKVDYAFPETQLSYKEQFEWIRSHYKENISIFTYSRCIFDYLDVLVKNGVLTKQNSSILYIVILLLFYRKLRPCRNCHQQSPLFL